LSIHVAGLTSSVAAANPDAGGSTLPPATIVVGLLGLGVFVLGAAWIGGPAGNPPVWQSLYIIGFFGYAAMLLALRNANTSAAAVLAAAIAVRLPLLLTPPDADCYRYLWEGRVQRLGMNPYAIAPDAPELARYRDRVWEQVQKKHYTAIYPPLAQAVFLVIAGVSYNVKAIQIGVTLIDFAVVMALLVTLRQLRRPAWYAAIYALSPITLTSYAQAGHIDVLMLLPLVLFAGFVQRRRNAAAAICLALTVLAKTVPVVLLIVLWRRSARAALLCGALIAAGYLPYASAGAGLVRTLFDFPQQDRFNSLFHVVTGGVPSELRMGLAVMILAGLIAWTLVGPGRAERSAITLLSAVLLLLPIVHFWYVTWVLPLVALRPAGLHKWLCLTLTMAIYWNAPQLQQAGVGWTLRTADVMVIWGPFLLVATLRRPVRRLCYAT